MIKLLLTIIAGSMIFNCIQLNKINNYIVKQENKKQQCVQNIKLTQSQINEINKELKKMEL